MRDGAVGDESCNVPTTTDRATMNRDFPADDDRTVLTSGGRGVMAETSPNALPAGHRLAEFELLRVIGEGGFGIVYLAQDHSLDRMVAVKEYLPSSLAARASNATAVLLRSQQHAQTFELGLRSFVNEARLLARFDHPALVKVYRFWEANGTAYMAMPFYEGRTLRDVVSERAPYDPPDEAWIRRTIAPVMDALDLMHAQRCLHRDVAPDNILLLPDGRPVLLDLGAARRVIGDKTQALTVILKAGYAPVEQYATAPGVEQGPWTDVYALGAVLHFVLTQEVPAASVTRVIHDSHAPLAISLSMSVRYAQRFLAGIDRCLAVRIADRPASIEAMRAALGWVGSTSDVAVAASSAAAQDQDDDATVIIAPALPPRVLPARDAQAVSMSGAVASSHVRASAASNVRAALPIDADVAVMSNTRPAAASGVGAAAAPPTRRRALALASAAVLAVVAGGGAWIALREPEPSPVPPVASPVPPRPAPAVEPAPVPAPAATTSAPTPAAPAEPKPDRTTNVDPSSSTITAPADSVPAPAPLTTAAPTPAPAPASASPARPPAAPKPRPKPKPAAPPASPGYDDADRAKVREQNRQLDDLLDRPRAPAPPAPSTY